MTSEYPRIFKIYSPGELTVLGFEDPTQLDHVDATTCRDVLTKLVRANKCKTLAFDLTRVKLIPSGLLGLLASLRKWGVDVHLYNASDDICTVLEITKLNQIMQVHKVAV
jgi:anti-anti-sigma factor